MIRYIMAAAALVGAMLLPAAAHAASEGFTTADVNMRAGPSTEYPRIVVLPRGAPVLVYGCVRGYTWCDVAYYGERGWVSSRYISIFYDDYRVYVPYTPRVQVPIITFDFGYWDTWYPRRPWYRDYRYRRGWDADRRGGGTVYYPRDRQNRDLQQSRPRDERRWTPRDQQEDADRRPNNRQRDGNAGRGNRQNERQDERMRILRPYSDSPEEAIRQQRQERSQRQERNQRQDRNPGQERNQRQERRQQDGGNRGDCVWINGRCEVPR
jgi:uncharacterized protein YraI